MTGRFMDWIYLYTKCVTIIMFCYVKLEIYYELSIACYVLHMYQ